MMPNSLGYLIAMYSREPDVKGSQCAWTRSAILKPRHVLKGYLTFVLCQFTNG